MTRDDSLIPDYLSQARTTDLQLVESKTGQVADIPSQEIILKVEEEDAETAAFGIMYAVSLLSFFQGLPAGISKIHYRERDIWSTEDFFRHLSFRRGKLHFYADYVRGRLMKTTIDISRDGTIRIATVNRGTLASLWVEYLLGKKGILEFISESELGTVQ